MTSLTMSRRTLLKTSAALATGALCAPALLGRAEAAAVKLKLSSSQEALDELKTKGVIIIPCDKEPFRKRVAPQADAFVQAHPAAKAVVDAIHATSA